MRSRKKIKLRVLVTAGATRAYLDDVRYLSNYSSGELGFLLSRKLKSLGVDVIAITGPSQFDFASLKLHKHFKVETPEEMRRATLMAAKRYRPEYGVFAAAVLDFVPKRTLKGKVSSKNSWKITLVPTRKIIDDVSRVAPKMKKIGFKLESKKMSAAQLSRFAGKKMKEKGLSGLCVNFFSDISAAKHRAYGFDARNRVTRLKSKAEIVGWVVGRIET